MALQQKIGQALIMTHDYQKAVDYYEAAVRAESRQVSMQHDLAELYYKLRQYDHAYRVLDALVENYGLMEDASSMEAVVKALLLLAKVHKGKGNTQAFMQTQMEARERQLRLVNRLRGEPELARVQKEAVADICFTLAQEYDAGLNRNYEQVRARRRIHLPQPHSRGVYASFRLLPGTGRVSGAAVTDARGSGDMCMGRGGTGAFVLQRGAVARPRPRQEPAVDSAAASGAQ